MGTLEDLQAKLETLRAKLAEWTVTVKAIDEEIGECRQDPKTHTKEEMEELFGDRRRAVDQLRLHQIELFAVEKQELKEREKAMKEDLKLISKSAAMQKHKEEIEARAAERKAEREKSNELKKAAREVEKAAGAEARKQARDEAKALKQAAKHEGKLAREAERAAARAAKKTKVACPMCGHMALQSKLQPVQAQSTEAEGQAEAQAS